MNWNCALAVTRSSLCLAAAATTALGATPEARITVHADQEVHRISRLLTGACLEDVNHEIYGGLDSQMIFGESFAEPVPPPPLEGFTAYGGRWSPEDRELIAAGGDGPKLLCDGPAFADGEAGVDVWFPDSKAGNAGLIVRVREPGPGADRFTGYEVSLDTSGQLVVGRHRQNWEPIRNVPCSVPVRQWVTLAVKMTGPTFEVQCRVGHHSAPVVVIAGLGRVSLATLPSAAQRNAQGTETPREMPAMTVYLTPPKPPSSSSPS